MNSAYVLGDKIAEGLESMGIKLDLLKLENLTQQLGKIVGIDLEPLEEIAIHTPTQKEYDTLMKVFEAGGWKWFSGELPTDSLKLLWKEYRDKCCVEAFNSFKYRDKIA